MLAAGEAVVPSAAQRAVTDHKDVAAALDARWQRAVPVDGRPTPMFGIRTVKGSLPLVVLAGHAPEGPDEVAFAPTTMRVAPPGDRRPRTRR